MVVVVPVDNFLQSGYESIRPATGGEYMGAIGLTSYFIEDWNFFLTA